jgi:ferrous iron transport protein A
MVLLSGSIGSSYLITGLALKNKNTERRLEMLGFIEGTPLMVLNKKSSGTMIIKVRDTRFAINGEIAAGIRVEVMD